MAALTARSCAVRSWFVAISAKMREYDNAALDMKANAKPYVKCGPSTRRNRWALGRRLLSRLLARWGGKVQSTYMILDGLFFSLCPIGRPQRAVPEPLPRHKRRWQLACASVGVPRIHSVRAHEPAR